MANRSMLLALLLATAAFPALAADPTGCVKLSERRGDGGCYVLATSDLGALPAGSLSWYLQRYPDLARAHAESGRFATVIDLPGEVWMMTIAAEPPQGSGRPVGAVGPLPVRPGVNYTAAFLDIVLPPRAESSVMRASGPQGLFVLAGTRCVETPAGRQLTSAGGAGVVIPGETPYMVAVRGEVNEHTLGLMLYPTGADVALRNNVLGWTPQGLCRG